MNLEYKNLEVCLRRRNGGKCKIYNSPSVWLRSRLLCSFPSACWLCHVTWGCSIGVLVEPQPCALVLSADYSCPVSESFADVEVISVAWRKLNKLFSEWYFRTSASVSRLGRSIVGISISPLARFSTWANVSWSP